MAQVSDTARGIWFTEQAGSAGTAYHLAVAIWFDGDLDHAAAAAACETVLSRHGALRTAIADVDGALRLIPAEAAPTVRSVPFTESLVAQEVARPFELSRGPLARFTLASASAHRHLLLFVAHHLVFDGMSKDILVRELAAAYSAAVEGSTAALPELTSPDAESAEAAEPVGSAREFWQQRRYVPGPAVLPGLTRTPTAAEPGAALEFELDAGHLAQAAEQLGLTRFEVLLTTVRAMLHRYGDPAPTIAVDLSTRTGRSAGHIGLFVNELPVAVEVPAAATFRALAGAVRAELRELYRFRGVPLTSAVSGLRPAAALAPVSVSYRRRSTEEAKFSGVDATVSWLVFNQAARNALHIQVVDSAATVAVSLQHSPAAIDAAAVARIGAHLRTLLAAVAAEPDRAVAELDLLPARERDLLLHGWNATARPYPGRQTLPDAFAKQVRTTPDALAVLAPDAGGLPGRLSYAELDEAVARCAALLRRRGVGHGSLVAVCLGRSVQSLVALLAVGRAGAAYLPVDPGYPPARRALVLADAAPALVVTASSLLAELDPALPVLVLDDIADLASADPASVDPAPAAGGEPVVVQPGDLAYVIYTSGSTGRPKGVAVGHEALANLLLAFGEALGSGPDDRWLWLTSLSFDISALEAYLPLITGGQLVIAPEPVARDGAALVELISSAEVTHVQATPSGWRMLLDSGFGEAGGTGEAGGDRLPVALAGGEALPVPLAAQLRSRVGRLFNVYGPTETTIWSTIEELPAEFEQVSIGRPIANTQVYVLDAALRPLPIGLPGELCLGGTGLAQGYLNRPELTGERFVPDPFAGGDRRLYRTGDNARYLPDGRIVFLGRGDNQVKIRGHRIELGEIEARLLEHPAVAQAAVVLDSSAGDGDARLIGYVVPRGAAPEPAALRELLARTLPAATVPSAWMMLERMPLTPNGKLDRAALPPVAAAAPVTAQPVTAQPNIVPPAAEPLDDVTEQVREIWLEVLGLDEIGLDDDLFDLGGHSLMITRIIARIRKQLGVNVPLDVFYDTPTIGEVVEVIVRMRP